MRRIVLLSVLALAWLLPRAAESRSIARGSDDDPTELAIHLPLDTADERRLVIAAIDMPATQTAIRQCLARGYVRRPEGDRATAPVLGTSAICFLAFEKPGYTPPPNGLGAPVVMVATLQSDGSTRTKVAEAFVILDGNTNGCVVWSPDGPPPRGTSMLDAPFEVEPDRVVFDESEREFFSVYATCAAVSNSLCVVAGIGAGLVGTPVVGISTALICISNRSMACLDRAFAYWPRR